MQDNSSWLSNLYDNNLKESVILDAKEKEGDIENLAFQRLTRMVGEIRYKTKVGGIFLYNNPKDIHTFSSDSQAITYDLMKEELCFEKPNDFYSKIVS